jgi:hypothetical protein
MSALAIAAVTAALKDLLNEGLLNHDLSTVGSFSVTAQPPDRITTGNTENNQLNVFLYQVTPNAGWRNADLASRDSRGGRLSNPALALDLHYLLTAYGAQDLNAEVLLGFAMQLLHETPIFTRERLRVVLGTPSPVDGSILPGPFGALSALDLADQTELIKITPVFLGSEELSKLWTAMQARYRPSMAYMVSVVLIQSDAGARVPPPVLRRGSEDQGWRSRAMPPPVLQAVRNLASPLLPAMRLGDDLSIVADLPLGATITANFLSARQSSAVPLPVTLGAHPNELRVHLPTPTEKASSMSDWVAGGYSVSLTVAEPKQPDVQTDAVQIALAPRIAATPLTSPASTPINLTITCEPRVHKDQQAGVRLLIGTLEVRPTAIATPADPTQPSTLTFAIPGLPAGDHLLRLRVDGIDSLPVVLSGSPPNFAFDLLQMVKVT